MKFCSYCKGSLIKQIPELDDKYRDVCSDCGHIFYDNPKIIVGILPVYHDKILLCKRAIEPKYGKWTLPSGFMENEETLEQGAKREAFEEAGIEVNNLNLYVTYSIPHISQVYFLFRANLIKPEWNNGIETLESQLYSLDQIPWNEIAFSAVSYTLTCYVNDYATNEFPLHSNCFK